MVKPDDYYFKVNQWFAQIMDDQGLESNDVINVLDDIMMVHDLQPEQTFGEYLRQMNKYGELSASFVSAEDLYEWLVLHGHI
jgi:predicted metalloendopeptidase